MLVVIGIIALVSAVAVPAFKGTVDDMKTRKSLNEIDMLIDGYRSHYLIFNEFPKDTGTGEIDSKIVWAFPSYIVGKTKTSSGNYTLKIVPYEGSGYDFQNWMGTSYELRERFAIGIGIYGWGGAEKVDLLKKHYGEESLYGGNVLFKEIDTAWIRKEDSKHRNRYY